MILGLVAAIALLHFYFQERNKKRVSFVVHVQERTEEAETLDFAVSLFDDESPGKWQEKLDTAFKMAEDRRAFNFKRMQDQHLEAKKALEAARAEEKKSTIGLVK